MTLHSSRWLAEPMEPRILHSADLPLPGWSAGALGSMALHDDASPGSTSARSSVSTPASPTSHAEIVFVDATLPDAASLVADLQAQRSAGRPIEVVIIAAGSDGLTTISDTLAARRDINQVHVLAHGSDGQMQLGTARLDAATLLQRADEVAAWSNALTADADLLLYGCELAQTAVGQRLVRDLALLTGADVAASIDLTGAASTGGNWALEYRSGSIEARIAPSLWQQTQWSGVLATYTVTTTADGIGSSLLVGSLRWAISQANANPGADRIEFAVNGTFSIAPGSKDGNDNKDGDFDINGLVDIVGNGSGSTILNGNGIDRVLDIRSGTVSLSGLTVQGGVQSTGGGIRIAGSAQVTLTDVVVQSNFGNGNSKGGGIYNDGSLTLRRVLIANNGSAGTGDIDGAGIYNKSGATLDAQDVEIRNNHAGTKDGGGIHADGGSVLLTNVTLADNQAHLGGGLFNKGNDTRLVNATLSGNQAVDKGGALWTDDRLILDHVTVVNNLAGGLLGSGGGLYDDDGDAVVGNSIFAGNSSGNFGGDRSTSAGYNLVDDASSGFNATGDRIVLFASLGLGGLADNGGYTRTVAIAAGSSARDGANPVSALTTDQRGIAFFGGRADIGAYEYNPFSFAPTIGTVADQTLNEDTTLAPVSFTIGDRETAPGSLVVTATSSNAVMIPNANIVLGGSGASRSISLTPAADASGGPATITITVSDGTNATSTTFKVTVLPVNDLPSGSVTLSGTAEQGQTLTASNTLSDPEGLGTMSYLWLADGSAISGATGSTLLLTQAQVGKLISVRARYTDGMGTAESSTSAATAPVANVNDAPTGSVTIFGSVTNGSTLTVSNSLADADGLGPITYQWAAGGTDIAGATGNSYTLGPAEGGQSITVRASYVDRYGTSESITSAGTAPVTSTNFAPTGTVTIAGLAAQGATLTASNTLADPDGLGTIGYQWLADGIAIGGATTDSLLPGQTHVGRLISVVASYTDAFGTAESASSSSTAAVANVNDLPTGNVTLSGTPTQGQTLTAANTLADADGLGSIGYQWFADGIAIGGATGNTLLLAQAQVAKLISVTASYVDGFGTPESVTSLATAAVANVNDLPSGSVTINGTATQGQLLIASHSMVDPDGLGTITYQWLEDGQVIAGATSDSLFLEQSHVGRGISVSASYIDGFGTAESRTSLATAAVFNINDAPTGNVSIDGTPTQGQTLTAANTLADADGLGSIGYQWFAGGVAIGGASGNTLLLTQAQVGKLISATASYTDGFGNAASVSSLATAAVANINDAPTGNVSIGGTPTQGQTLTAANSLADDDGLGSIGYQWFAGGVAIGGASGNTLPLTQAQVGKVISVTASYTDGFGNAASVSSLATAAVANVNDAPTGNVSIGGVSTQGQTLTAANSLADDDGLGSIGYQWFAGGVAIGGASGNTLLLTQGQVGKVISVTASYTDGFGTAESVSSLATAAVANVNDAPTGNVSIGGTLTQGQTLTAANTLADADGLGSIGYQWFAGGSAITGATGSTLLLTQAQVNKPISVTASYVDGFGTAEVVRSAVTASVTPRQEAPSLLGSIPDMTVREDEPWRFTLPADLFSRASTGEALSLRATTDSGSALPGWLRFDAATGIFSGTPTNDDVGSVSVRVTATDREGRSATGDFGLRIENTNDAPLLAQPLAPQSVRINVPMSFQLPAASFVDADVGDTLRYQATLADGSALPNWLHFDAARGLFTADPGPGAIGQILLRVTATDAAGATAQGLFAFTVSASVVLPPPVAAEPAPPPVAALAPEDAPAAEDKPQAATPSPSAASTPGMPGGGLLEASGPLSPSATDDAGPARAAAPTDEAPRNVNVSRADDVLAEAVVPQYTDLLAAPLMQLLQNDDLLHEFDELQRQMAEGSLDQRSVLASSIAVTSGLSIGYVVWLVRGGVLASSMLSALPAWKLIDPLPVLAAAGAVKRHRGPPAADADSDVERLFDRPEPQAPRATSKEPPAEVASRVADPTAAMEQP